MRGSARNEPVARGERPVARVRLTAREAESLELLAAGMRTSQIAQTLGIQAVTVEMHVKNAREKLNATTREQAVGLAIANDLIRIPNPSGHQAPCRGAGGGLAVSAKR